jgi:hypothetical protein
VEGEGETMGGEMLLIFFVFVVLRIFCQVTRHAGHVVPSNPLDPIEWTHFCRSLKADPYVSQYLLRVVHVELASRGFVSQDDEGLSLADTLFDIPSHERESVVTLFIECQRQTLLGSSLCRIGGPNELPTIVGPGGLSVLFPLPLLSEKVLRCCCKCSQMFDSDSWPDLSNSGSASRIHAKLLDCLRLTSGALSAAQWLQFDEETCRGGVEEACLFAMRLVSCNSPLPLELPLLWSRFKSEEAISAVSALLSEVRFNFAFLFFFFSSSSSYL